MVVNLLLISVAQAEVNLNISGSQVEMQNSDTFRMLNVTSPEYPGVYWVDFKWDPVNLVFVPVNVGTEMLYKISGYVKTTGGAALTGAEISINRGTCSNTDQTGYYSCNNLSNGVYTVLASKSGYSITPLPAIVNLSNTDKAQDFTAAAATYTISGTVTGLPEGASATIGLSGTATKSTITVGGAYSFTGLLAGNYTVMPSLSGYMFTPTSSSFSLSSDITKNFTATPLPYDVTTINSFQEILRNALPPGATDLYLTVVPVAGSASFQNATRDWLTRRDMLVMYGGAACDQLVPDLNDYNTIMAGISNGTFPVSSETGVMVNNRTFYYNFQDVMNQGVLLGRLNKPAAPAGCYYVLIYNVSSTDSDYSLFFSTMAR